MQLFDVNVLVNAYRQDAQHHVVCREWVDRVLASPAAFGTSTIILSGFLRIVTHRRVFKTPSPLNDALEFVEIFAGAPQAVPVEAGRRHWSIFTDLCVTARASGNLIPDAYLAALAIESGSEFVTLDRDFGRFPDLVWTDPTSK